MIDGFGPIGFLRRDNALEWCKQIIVETRILSALIIPIVQMAELYMENSGLNGIESSVVAFDFVVVLARLPMVAQHANSGCDVLIMRCDRACLAAGPKILARIKAESSCFADGSRLLPALVFLRKVPRAMGLARILDHQQIVFVGQCEQWIHICHVPVKVNRDD